MLRYWTLVLFLAAGLVAVALGGMRIAQGTHSQWGHSGYLLHSTYLPDEVMLNTTGSPCGTEYLVTSITDSFDSATSSAVTNWNNTLRDYDPNRLTKYVFHYNVADDPSSCVNIRVWAVDSGTHAQQCGSAAYHGCLEDDDLPESPPVLVLSKRPLWVIMDAGEVTLADHKISDTAHEMGHALIFGEHAGTSYNCESIMGHSSTENSQTYCSQTIVVPTSHDRNDFYAAYKPQDSANPTSMTIDSSSKVTFDWSSAQLDNIVGFYWFRETDAPGSGIASGTVSRTTTSKQFTGIANGDRWCVRVNGYTTAGFPSLLPFSPSSRYGCVSKGTGPSAGGPFVATTHRNSSDNLRIRVKNYSGGQRAMIVTGPSLYDGIGCPNQSVANGGTYSCTSSVARGRYPNLTWWATSGSSASYGPVDFD